MNKQLLIVPVSLSVLALLFTALAPEAAAQRLYRATSPSNGQLEEVPYRVSTVAQQPVGNQQAVPAAVGNVYLEPPAEQQQVETVTEPVQLPIIGRRLFGHSWLQGSLVGGQLRGDSLAGVAPGLMRQWWARTEYLVAWRRGQAVPALATSSTAGTALANAGVLGLGSTQLLVGNQTLADDSTPGGRVEVGFWMPSHNRAIVARFTALGTANTLFELPASSNTILARPFFNTAVGAQQSLPINFPGSESGSMSILTASDVLALDVFVRRPWRRSGRATVDFLWGYQMSRIDESLTISHSSTNADGRNGIPIGTQLDVTDHFETRNQFHGGMLGILAEIDGGCWTMSMLGKLGLGNMDQTVIIAGESVITDPGGGVNTQPGLLAGSSNSGVFKNDQFAAVPEFELRYNRQLSEAVTFSVGYSCIFWTRAVQPGNQIDLNVDDAGGTAPVLSIDSDKYWLQALSMGVSWRF